MSLVMRFRLPIGLWQLLRSAMAVWNCLLGYRPLFQPGFGFCNRLGLDLACCVNKSYLGRNRVELGFKSPSNRAPKPGAYTSFPGFTKPLACSNTHFLENWQCLM